MSKSSAVPKSFQPGKEVGRKLSEALGECLEQNVLLATYTTFGVGGKADFFYRAKTPTELARAIRWAQELSLQFFVLGGGSNILIGDSGFRGLAIKNECSEILTDRETITCQSGATLQHLVDAATENSLSGLEFAVGIPGTVGGAIRGNAGAFGKGMGDVLTRAVILTPSGDIRQVEGDYLEFTYRESRLKHNKEVALSATFRLSRQDKRDIKRKVESNLGQRKERIPWQSKSAGCFFKNVDGPQGRISAGFLLEQAGAKGMWEGDAKVSPEHANILINAGDAKASDIRKLARRLKEKVKQKFNIELEEEVVYIN